MDLIVVKLLQHISCTKVTEVQELFKAASSQVAFWVSLY